MEYEFTIANSAGTTRLFDNTQNTHKALVRWMKDNVGIRGQDWNIKKPTNGGWHNTVRVRDKDKAALVKMTYSEYLIYKP